MQHIYPSLGDPLCLGASVRYDGARLSFCLEMHGRRWRVSVPVEVAHLALDHAFAAEGIREPAELGELPSCGGLLKRARRASRKAGRKATRALGKAGKAVAKGAKKLVQSKALAAIVGASAIVCPAVGGPALAALAAGKAAAKVADAASRGDPKARQAAVRLASNASRLSESRHPMARLAVAGLRSVA